MSEEGKGPDKWEVRIKAHGDKRPFTWKRIEADSPIAAIHSAFREDYWPERFEYLPEPVRLTVTATQLEVDEA